MATLETLLRDGKLSSEGIGRTLLADYIKARSLYVADQRHRGGNIPSHQKDFLVSKALDTKADAEDRARFFVYIRLRDLLDTMYPRQIIAYQDFRIAYQDLEHIVSTTLEAENIHSMSLGSESAIEATRSHFEAHRGEHLINHRGMVRERIEKLHSAFVSMLSFDIVLDCISEATKLEDIKTQELDLVPLLCDLEELQGLIWALLDTIQRGKADPPFDFLPDALSQGALTAADMFSFLELSEQKRLSTKELKEKLAEVTKLPVFGDLMNSQNIEMYKKGFSLKRILGKGLYEVEQLSKELQKNKFASAPDRGYDRMCLK